MLDTQLNQLSSLGTITLYTNGPPSPDNSLLRHPEFFGNIVLIQRAGECCIACTRVALVYEPVMYLQITVAKPHVQYMWYFLVYEMFT